MALDTSGLSSDTRITWSNGAEPDLAGYRIGVRETTAAKWHRSHDVGLVTEHTLTGQSKDNLLFGVAACDTAGHCSPFVFAN